MRRRSLPSIASVATLLCFPAVAQQSNQMTPQQRYERQMAYCNSGKLPDPERNACVRDAGLQLDRSLGGAPRNQATTSEDGRATIIGPSGLPAPDSGSSAVTSPDGRSTIVVPAYQEAPRQ